MRRRKCAGKKSRPAETDNIDVGPVTETDLQDDLTETSRNPFCAGASKALLEEFLVRATLVGTIQLLLGSAVVSTAVFGVPPKPLWRPLFYQSVMVKSTLDWPARRRPERPGSPSLCFGAARRSRSPILLNRSGLARLSQLEGDFNFF